MSDLPNIFSRIKNLAKSAKEVTEHYLETGEVLAGEAASIRLNLCNNCPKKKDNLCTVCGCYLVGTKLTPGKTELAAESCPLGKWKSNKELLNE